MRPPTSSSAACTHRQWHSPHSFTYVVPTRGVVLDSHRTNRYRRTAGMQPNQQKQRQSNTPLQTPAMCSSHVLTFEQFALGLRCRYCVAGTRNCSLLPGDFPQQHSQQRRERKCVGLFSGQWVKHTTLRGLVVVSTPLSL